MNRLRPMLFAAALMSASTGQACKSTPEEPDSNKTAGEEIEQGAQDTSKAVDEAADDTGEAIDEGVEDTGETIDEAADDSKDKKD